MPDKNPIALKETKPTPVQRWQDSSWFSKLIYYNIVPLLKRGAKREIGLNDFQEIDDNDDCEQLATKILKEFKETAKTGKISLWIVLYRVYFVQYAIGGIFVLIEVFAQLAQGFMLSKLLQQIQNSIDSGSVYWLAFWLSAATFVHGFLHHIQFFIGMRTGMRIRIGLIAAIYKKCLQLSTSNTASTGFIVNLVSNDVQRFEDAAPFAHYVWVVPIQLVLTMIFIYIEIGWLFVVPLILLGLLIPLQGLFAKKFMDLRKGAVKYRDDRIKSVSDMLLGILVVKLYAWEIPFMKQISKMRGLEIDAIWKGNIMKSINEATFFVAGVVINSVTFLVYYYTGGVLTTSKVFSVFTYVNFLKLSLTNFLPKAIQLLSECIVSVSRIEKFLNLPEVNIDQSIEEKTELLSELNDPRITVAIQNGSFSWSDGERNSDALTNINFKAFKSTLTFICGPVGAGKTSLLHAIMGDIHKNSGKVATTARKFAYVSQSAWVLSGTIKDNITFGLAYNKEKFDRVASACSLTRDFTLFPNGADSILGERGLTLSGGQRARVSLARAVYADADIYLLDDPFSAVDTKVGRQILENCVLKLLKEKTVICVTHQLHFLPFANQIYVVENGKISASGSLDEILDSKSKFCENIKEFSSAEPSGEVPEEKDSLNELEYKSNETTAAGTAKLEDMAKGSVSLSLYFKYLLSGSSSFMAIGLLLSMILGQALVVSNDIWLSRWSSASVIEQDRVFYQIVLITIVVCAVALAIGRALLFFYVCFLASESSFHQMLKSVFRSPISFFQLVPHGRLMNRFSKDIALMDEMLPQVFFDFSQSLFVTISSFAIGIAFFPFLAVTIPFLLTVFYYLRKYYLLTTRQIKRWEAITRSPVYSSIPTTLEGLSIIRSFAVEERFLKEFNDFQNTNTRVFFSFLLTSRWLGFRLDLIASVMVTIASFGIIIVRNWLNLNSGATGLLLSYLLQLTGLLQWCVRQSAELETMMIATERVYEYSELPSEAATSTDTEIPPNWPSKGEIEVENMNLSYPVGDTPDRKFHVLKNISISLPPGTKCGIVGRTGAGKSSFLQALFRLVEPEPANCIRIDGLGTTSLGLTDLRSKISIIPQEPFCFKGTLRFNLDPFNYYSDDKLWESLAAVELKRKIEMEPDKLDCFVEENGANWSVGERQLICLARAIIRNTKLIVMDEATSSVDINTDQLIQKAIRSVGGMFADATVLTIAHRLNTVIDYDKILVLEAGEIVEFGSPQELLKKSIDEPTAWFARMVSEMTEEAQLHLKSIAFGSNK